MFVDPDVLRSFADQVQIASTAISEAGVGQKVSSAADGLDGSTTQWAARLVGGHVNTVAEHIAKSINDMGVAVRGAGDKYEVDDGALSGKFGGIF